MAKLRENKLFGPAVCALAALIWGLSFVAQKSGAHIGTFTFNGIRTFIGGLVLLPLAVPKIIRSYKNSEDGNSVDLKKNFIGGLFCGIVLFIAGNLQQHAFSFDIQAGKVGFITALYMILVPIIGRFLGKKIRWNIIIALVLGVAGLYLLCINKNDFRIGRGEIFALACALGFAIHILTVDHFCVKTDTILLACFQFLVAGALGIICMFIFEEPQISEILDSAIPILYAGIFSCGVAFTLQILGQKYTEPSVASLLMCLESVFSVIFGWLILHDTFSLRAIIGCVIMFIGVILTQINFSFKSEVKV